MVHRLLSRNLVNEVALAQWGEGGAVAPKERKKIPPVEMHCFREMSVTAGESFKLLHRL